MTKLMKQQLINDILTGLLVAATFALVVPADAFAQLNTSVQAAQNNVLNPIVRTVSYVSYGLGTVMVIAGIAHVKKHTDQPANHTLTGGLGKLGTGAAFLAAPKVIEMLGATGDTTAQGSLQSSVIPVFQ